MFFTQIYIYDNNNKNIYMLIYKKNLKRYLRLFHKTFSNCQATYQKELYLLFLSFMVMQIRKPENEDTFLGNNGKEDAEKEQGQD